VEKLIIDFTEDEEEMVLDELAERLKNLVYMFARSKIEEAYQKLKDMSACHDGEDKITITVELGFIVNDLFEVVGGFRRNKEDKDETV